VEKEREREHEREREREKENGRLRHQNGTDSKMVREGEGERETKKRNFWRTEKIAPHEKGATCTCLDSGMRLGFTYSYTGLHILVRSTFSYVGTCIGRHT